MYHITPETGFFYDVDRVSIIQDQIYDEPVAAATIGDLLDFAADTDIAPSNMRRLFSALRQDMRQVRYVSPGVIEVEHFVSGELLFSHNAHLLPRPNNAVQHGIKVASFPAILKMVEHKEQRKGNVLYGAGKTTLRIIHEFADAVML